MSIDKSELSAATGRSRASDATRTGHGANWLVRALMQEDLNFLLTNRIPRREATRFMGWFSRIENPVVCSLSIAAWKLFATDLDLSEAETQRFRSLRDCFTRRLRAGARPIDPDPQTVVSPCDAIVGASGRIAGTSVIQAKGFPYALGDLFRDSAHVERYRDGTFVTLRLRSSMYHRFHAPCDAHVTEVTYVSGDTWNVNPIALRRVEKLFCKNERAIIELVLPDADQSITLVPVAAILVASIKLHCLADVLDLKYRGPNRIACDAAFRKGDEMGYFQNGSTIIAFASDGFELCPCVVEGANIRMGKPLFRSNARGRTTRTNVTHSTTTRRTR